MSMLAPVQDLTATFISAVQQCFPDLEDAETYVEVTRSTQEKFGHYQFNGAMRLAKPLKTNPRQVAEEIKAKVAAATSERAFVASMEIAGPGFINISLHPSYLADLTQAMLRDDRLAVPLPKHPQRIVIDFSSPNTAKEMHVGHLRSTIIGDSLARVFEFLGHDVLRLNHIGDWGTQFGMLIAYMKEEAPDVLKGQEQTDLSHLVGWYKESKQRFDSDTAFRKRAQHAVVELQSGEATARQAWNLICEISRRAYQEIYDLLDVRLTERGESFYNDTLPATVAELESKGLVEESDGAKCLFLEGFKNRDGDPLPLMVQKSDGGYNYDTTDMAAIKQRIFEEKADRLIYVTDAGQAQHFQMIFAAAAKAGYLDPARVRCDHVPFGLVLGPDGKKFKTRSGETVKLSDLLSKAIEKARAAIEERGSDRSEEERAHLAHVIGMGAVKYADLSSHRTSDYRFSFDRMLQLEGNTAVFLYYAYARVNGIKRKVGIDPSSLMDSHRIHLEHAAEIHLAVHLAQFRTTLEAVAEDLLPHRLTDYLYELANRFNAFFRDCRVEGSEHEAERLLLCELVARVMARGLNLLGLRLVDRM